MLARVVTAVSTAAAICLVLSSNAFANNGHWKFQVVNKGTVPAIEFRTKENGEWSSNWITERIEPGHNFDMDFNHSDGDCTVRTQIHFLDGTYFDADVDYCKTSTLYIYDKELRWE